MFQRYKQIPKIFFHRFENVFLAELVFEHHRMMLQSRSEIFMTRFLHRTADCYPLSVVENASDVEPRLFSLFD